MGLNPPTLILRFVTSLFHRSYFVIPAPRALYSDWIEPVRVRRGVVIAWGGHRVRYLWYTTHFLCMSFASSLGRCSQPA